MQRFWKASLLIAAAQILPAYTAVMPEHLLNLDAIMDRSQSQFRAHGKYPSTFGELGIVLFCFDRNGGENVRPSPKAGPVWTAPGCRNIYRIYHPNQGTFSVYAINRQGRIVEGRNANITPQTPKCIEGMPASCLPPA